MGSSANLKQLRDLVRVQEVLTFDATAALADARDEEITANEAALAASREVERMAEHWYRHLSGPVMPERGSIIASMLIDREDAAKQSDDACRRAVDHSAEMEGAWRSADASERASGRIVDTLRRKQARKADERALDALADRVTIKWMNK
jgi:hypothetical protein